MANINAPKGFIPIKQIDGSPWNGQTNMFLIPASDGTAVFVGDAVKLINTAGAAGTFVSGINCEGMPIVGQAGVGDKVCGVVVGVLPLPPNLQNKHRPASTAAVVLVVDGPDTIFEIQETGTALTTSNGIGKNFNVTLGTAGSTTTGVSGMQLDTSTVATTNTLVYRIFRLASRPDNALGTNAKWEVGINLHQYRQATGI